MIKDNENVVIVIASHNNATTIKKAIESVTKGIRPANKIVVGDNDSSDGTYKLLCNLLGAEKITIDGKTGWPPKFDGELNGIPVTIFRKKLSTISHTTNIAIQMGSQGATVFGFMDPTSWYAPDKITQAIGVFHRQPSVVCVVSDCDNHHPDGTVERIFRYSFDMQRLLASFPYDRNFLIRPQIFSMLTTGFNEQLTTMDDYDFLLRVAERGLIYHVPAPLHHNIVPTIDENTRKNMDHSATIIRQLASRRRDKNNG